MNRAGAQKEAKKLCPKEGEGKSPILVSDTTHPQ